MKGIDKLGDKQFQMTDHSWNVFLNHVLIIFPRLKFTNSPLLGKYSAFSVSSFSFSYFFKTYWVSVRLHENINMTFDIREGGIEFRHSSTLET